VKLLGAIIMKSITEPNEPVVQIEPENWKEFLSEFSQRNYNRRARFEMFQRGNVSEESQKANLEEISLKQNGNSISVEIIRIDRTNQNNLKIKDEVTNVRGISVQFDVDGSEDVLEITDNENSLISLKLESKVDGDA
jgi:hypothetical protein